MTAYNIILRTRNNQETITQNIELILQTLKSAS